MRSGGNRNAARLINDAANRHSARPVRDGRHMVAADDSLAMASSRHSRNDRSNNIPSSRRSDGISPEAKRRDSGRRQRHYRAGIVK